MAVPADGEGVEPEGEGVEPEGEGVEPEGEGVDAEGEGVDAEGEGEAVDEPCPGGGVGAAALVEVAWHDSAPPTRAAMSPPATNRAPLRQFSRAQRIRPRTRATNPKPATASPPTTSQPSSSPEALSSGATPPNDTSARAVKVAPTGDGRSATCDTLLKSGS